MKALILNNKVVDLCETEFEVHSDLTWVDATDAAEVGGTWDGTTFFPADTRTDAQKAADDLLVLREERNRLLAETDYLGLSDNTMSAAMTTYRQALRDITETYTSLDDVVWPTKPE